MLLAVISDRRMVSLGGREELARRCHERPSLQGQEEREQRALEARRNLRSSRQRLGVWQFEDWELEGYRLHATSSRRRPRVRRLALKERRADRSATSKEHC